jgi:PAS domain S-box-containing protein
VHPEDRPIVRRILEQALPRQERFECEYRIVLPGGAIRYARGIGRPVFGKNGEVEEYIGTTADITTQRETEDRLRRSEQEFRTLAENLPDGVIRYDRACRRIYVNPAHVRNMGATYDQVINADLKPTWGGDISVEDYSRIVRQVMDDGKPAQVQGKWIRPDGCLIYFEVHMAPERNAQGEVESVLAISRNITSIKETELRLKESQTLLRQLADRSETVREEERKHLARELHDELAQHLSALRMRIAVCQLDAANSADTLDRTAPMIELVDGAIGMVRNIITSLRPAALDMGMLSALQWLADDFAVQNGIPCALRVDRGSYELTDRSATAIFRIAQESLRNIARHAEASKVYMALWLSRNQFFLEIADNGKGFDPDVKKENSFGLIGIRERSLILGGDTHVISTPGHGTTIRVHVPVGS